MSVMARKTSEPTAGVFGRYVEDQRAKTMKPALAGETPLTLGRRKCEASVARVRVIWVRAVPPVGFLSARLEHIDLPQVMTAVV